MTTPTSKPVPSNQPADLLFNAEKNDEFINGMGLTFFDRFGVEKLTAKGIAAAAAQQIDDSMVVLDGKVASAAAHDDSAAAHEAGALAAKVGAQNAQSAALIAGGTKTTVAAGLADASIADGDAFRKQGTGDVAVEEYRKSRNLFDSTAARDGKAINATTGNIQDTPGSGVSPFIPVIGGKTYTLSGVRARSGIALYSSMSDTAYVAGTYDGTTTLPLKFTPPSNGYVVFGLYTSTGSFSSIKFEVGDTATPYSAYNVPAASLIATFPAKGYVDKQAARIDATTTTLASRNLFDATTVRDGKFLNSGNGAIQSLPGWGISAHIPLAGLTNAILSGIRGRQGMSFFTADNDAALIAGSYNGDATMPLRLESFPAGATHVVFALYRDTTTSPKFTNIQFEPGLVATDYIPKGGSKTFAAKAAIYPPVNEASPTVGVSKLVLSSTDAAGDYSSYIETPLGTGTLKRGIRPFKPVTHAASAVWNYFRESLDGTPFHFADDDVSPYRAFGTTVGANHGYAKTICTVTGHGKTLVDVGSRWTDAAAKEWVIVEVPDANTLTVSARTNNATFSGGTLTHAGSATHTAAFTPSAVSNGTQEWHPIIKNRKLVILVDGVVITDYNNTYPFSREVVFAESYEIMNKSSMIEWLITQAGTATDILAYQGTADLAVSIAYAFDAQGAVVHPSDLLALNAVPAFQDIMFTQSFKLSDGVNGVVMFLIPDTLPFTQDSVSYDFRVPRAMTAFSAPNRLNFTPARTNPSGQLADHAIQMNDKVGLAIGYLPVLDADPAVRRTLAATKALQVSEIGKLYMSCIDSASITSLAAGDNYSAVPFRAWFPRTADRTAHWFVRSKYGDWLYVHWHITTRDRIPLPADFQGRAFEIFAKTANVTVRSKAATDSIVFEVAAAGSFAYARLRFPR